MHGARSPATTPRSPTAASISTTPANSRQRSNICAVTAKRHARSAGRDGRTCSTTTRGRWCSTASSARCRRWWTPDGRAVAELSHRRRARPPGTRAGPRSARRSDGAGYLGARGGRARVGQEVAHVRWRRGGNGDLSPLLRHLGGRPRPADHVAPSGDRARARGGQASRPACAALPNRGAALAATRLQLESAPGATGAARARAVRELSVAAHVSPAGAEPGFRRRDLAASADLAAIAARVRRAIRDLRRARRCAAPWRGPSLPRASPERRRRHRRALPLLDRLRAHRPLPPAAWTAGSRLPQHHPARVLSRRERAGGRTVRPRPGRATELAGALHAGARRFRVQPAGARVLRLRAHRGVSHRSRSRTLWLAAGHSAGAAVPRRSRQLPPRRALGAEQANRGPAQGLLLLSPPDQSRQPPL